MMYPSSQCQFMELFLFLKQKVLSTVRIKFCTLHIEYNLLVSNWTCLVNYSPSDGKGIHANLQQTLALAYSTSVLSLFLLAEPHFFSCIHPSQPSHKLQGRKTFILGSKDDQNKQWSLCPCQSQLTLKLQGKAAEGECGSCGKQFNSILKINIRKVCSTAGEHCHVCMR